MSMFQGFQKMTKMLKRQIVENRQKTDKEAWLIVKSEVQCSVLRKSTITRGATTSEVYLIQTEFM